MTRASLLHILDHVNGISDAEIRELEQLAAAFPYCQSAHVLLAKAAHDRGSMLAGQRLRRAATYAADRELLRRLLEQPATPVAAFIPETQSVVSDEVAPPFVQHSPEAGETPALPEPDPAVDVIFSAEEPSLPSASPDQAPTEADMPSDTQELPVLETASEPFIAAPLVEEPRSIELPETIQPEAETAAEETEPAATEVPEAADLEPVALPMDAASDTVDESVASVSSESTPVEGEDDILPAIAPPIRPPADGGISRFEFGLSQPSLTEPVGYQLQGLEEEEDELPTLRSLTATPPPVVTAPFRADADLGYALGGGSRLGYDIESRDGYTLDLPLDAFFEPDALLLAHLKAHKPKPAASSFDLINRFLKAQPRIKTPGGIPLPAEEQPDLSVRSTSVVPALASESLAKIMVRQGKKDKAIEIYERLMERQPEKKAYFAEQIQQLQQPSE